MEEAYKQFRISKYKHQHREYNEIDDYIKDKEYVSVSELIDHTGIYCGSIGHHMTKMNWKKHKVKGKTYYSSSATNMETSSRISSKAG